MMTPEDRLNESETTTEAATDKSPTEVISQPEPSEVVKPVEPAATSADSPTEASVSDGQKDGQPESLPNEANSDASTTTESANPNGYDAAIAQAEAETITNAETLTTEGNESSGADLSTASSSGGIIDNLPSPEPAKPPKPSLPAQPVPQVPPAPSPQDLSRIAQDLQIRKAQVEAVVQLLDTENTVPFITRYRKERTGGLDETQIRRIQARVVSLREIAAKKQSVLRNIANQGRLTDALTESLLAAESLKRIDDLYLPFKVKKKSLAAEAKEKGLEPLAIAIWTQDPIADNLDEVLPGIVDPWKQLHDVNDVVANLKLILAEMISDQAEVRGAVRAFLWNTAELVAVKIETVPEGKGTEYRDYFNFKEAVQRIPPHRVLAVNRGERENIIRIRIDLNREQAKVIATEQLKLGDHKHRALIESVVPDALERLLLPSLEREIRREMTEFSQDHAVDIFAKNLHSLLMRPPLGGKRVLAIDPGIRTGCKIAALDETGNLLEDAVIYPHPPQKKVAQAKRKLEYLIRKHQVSIVAIGNGTACRETEQLVSDLIAELEERRVNPQPVSSPIPQTTVETPASDSPIIAEPATETALPVATESATTETAVGLGGVAETTMTIAEVSLGDVPGTTPEQTPSLPVEPGMAATTTTETPSPEVAQPTPEPEEVLDFTGLPEASEALAYVIVNEAGASDYSASPQAKEEFPNLDATTRGTISIGRRLQDPLSELVKVDPQHIGVGLYQHDVRQKYLKASVESVIESCVNSVGVDLNTASVPLLRHISGFNQAVARNVVEYRTQQGKFTNREQLKNVPQMGEIRFTQAAGFLKITESDEPLDTTSIHPESYELARKILKEFEFEPQDLRDQEKLKELRQKLLTISPDEMAKKLDAGPLTVIDIYHAIARPGRDPREDRPKPIFRKGVLKIEDLSPGMELRGEVLNVVDFGAFVDVGLKDSGLVHISQLANRYIKSPHDVVAVGDVVDVWVLKVEGDRKRVSLTMIPPGQDRKPQGERQSERPPRGERPERGPRPPRAPAGPAGGERGPRPVRTDASNRPPVGTPPSGEPTARPAPPSGLRGQGSGGPRPGGRRPTGPGAPGWRSAGKPTAQKPAPAETTTPAATPTTPAKKTPSKPKPTIQLSEEQKKGRSALNSFGQLAMFFNKQESEKSDKPQGESQTE